MRLLVVATTLRGVFDLALNDHVQLLVGILVMGSRKAQHDVQGEEGQKRSKHGCHHNWTATLCDCSSSHGH